MDLSKAASKLADVAYDVFATTPRASSRSSSAPSVAAPTALAASLLPASRAHKLTVPSGKSGGASVPSPPTFVVALFVADWCLDGSSPRCATSFGGTGTKLCMQLCEDGEEQCSVNHRPGVQVVIPAGSVVLIVKGSSSNPSAVSSRFISPQTLEASDVYSASDVVGKKMTAEEFADWCDEVQLEGPTEDEKTGKLRLQLKTPAKTSSKDWARLKSNDDAGDDDASARGMAVSLLPIGTAERMDMSFPALAALRNVHAFAGASVSRLTEDMESLRLEVTTDLGDVEAGVNRLTAAVGVPTERVLPFGSSIYGVLDSVVRCIQAGPEARGESTVAHADSAVASQAVMEGVLDEFGARLQEASDKSLLEFQAHVRQMQEETAQSVHAEAVATVESVHSDVQAEAVAAVEAVHSALGKFKLPEDLVLSLDHGVDAYRTLLDVVLPTMTQCLDEMKKLKAQQTARSESPPQGMTTEKLTLKDRFAAALQGSGSPPPALGAGSDPSLEERVAGLERMARTLLARMTEGSKKRGGSAVHAKLASLGIHWETVADCKAWVEKHLSKDGYKLDAYADIFVLWSRLECKTSSVESHVKGVVDQGRAGYRSANEALLFATMQSDLPLNLGASGSASSYANPIPRLDKHSKWDNPAVPSEGFKNVVAEGMPVLEAQLGQAAAELSSQEARDLATSFTSWSVAFSALAIQYIINTLAELVSHGGFELDTGFRWLMGTTKRMLKDCSDERISGKDVGAEINTDRPTAVAKVLFALYRCHLKMSEFTQYAIVNHPSISTEQTKLLVHSYSKLDSVRLQASVTHAQTSADAARTQADKALKKAADLEGELKQLKSAKGQGKAEDGKKK